MATQAQNTRAEYERTAQTKQALLDAANDLFGKQGVEHTTVRQILEQAGQKNGAALQYHFGSKAGLIDALHRRHYAEELECRASLAAEIFKPGITPSAHDVASLMVRSVFRLMATNQSYRQWAAQFGHVWAERGTAMYTDVIADLTSDSANVGQNLVAAMPHIAEDILFYRLDQAIRFLALQSAVLAKDEAQLRGTYGALSEAMLIDTITGMFEADVSTDSQKTMKQLKSAWQATEGKTS